MCSFFLVCCSNVLAVEARRMFVFIFFSRSMLMKINFLRVSLSHIDVSVYSFISCFCSVLFFPVAFFYYFGELETKMSD
ncbi:hypothetical protein M432DRAFT_154712 [Thermoascus aurantiacus ATCC 26904]